jgi:hypothetical protein
MYLCNLEINIRNHEAEEEEEKDEEEWGEGG